MNNSFKGLMGGMGMSIAAMALLNGGGPLDGYHSSKRPVTKKPNPQKPTKKRAKVKAARKASRKKK